MTFSIELTALALVAMLVDAAIGGVRLLGRFPGPDRLFYYLSEIFCSRLDHAHRSDRDLMVRGAGLVLLSLVFLLPFGIFTSDFILGSKFGAGVGLVLLILIIGQRSAIDTALELITILSDVDSRQDQSRFEAARWGIERLVLRLCDGLIVNVVILFITGLSGLLFYRMLTMLLTVGAPSGILKPASPFYRIPLIIYEMMTIIPAALATLLISVASLIIPGAQLHLFSIIMEDIPDAIWGRKLPLLSIAHAMQFSFRQDPNKLGKKTLWVGPTNGRRNLEAEDLRNALYLIIASWVMCLIMMTLMAFPMIYRI